MTYIVALTGGIGSGKSTIAKLFNELDVPVIDADVISKELLTNNPTLLELIFKQFGQIVKSDNQQLNKAILKEIIFNVTSAREWLNNLLHPLIQEETERQFSANTSPYLLWVCPLLIENSLYTRADSVIVAEASPDTQRSRVMLRDNITLDLINKILSSQLSNAERRHYASHVINTESSLDEIKQVVQQLHYYYVQKATPLLAAEKG